MRITKIRKIEGKKQIIGAEVYAPDMTDAHGDFMTAEEIEKMAYGFMKDMRLDQVDVGHDNELYGCHLVESFIARKCDDLFIPGAWVVYIHVPDKELWAKIENGEINGLSMEALAIKKESHLELNCPVMVAGRTEKSDDGHSHHYNVFIDEEGNFAGGSTDIVNDHKQDILSGTLTEEENDHVHKYSFVEIILELENGEEED